jgi:hypothetical protein
VLLEAIREGLRLLTWSRDSFAYADSFDEDAKRYRGLRCGEVVNISQDNLTGLLVRPEVALRQREAETEIRKPPEEPGDKTPTTAATATASATQAVSRHREPHSSSCRPRCKPYRRRGDRPSRRARGIFRQSHPRNRGEG